MESAESAPVAAASGANGAPSASPSQAAASATTAAGGGWSSHVPGTLPPAVGQVAQLRQWHRTIQDTISEIQGKTSRIMQEQERDLLRSFRSRLADLQEELDAERRKNEFGSVEWVHKCRKLQEELDWLRALSERLTNENDELVKESKRLKRQLKTQEEDREFLVKQLVAVKKENAHLRTTLEDVQVQAAQQSAELTQQVASLTAQLKLRESAEAAQGSAPGTPTSAGQRGASPGADGAAAGERPPSRADSRQLRRRSATPGEHTTAHYTGAAQAPRPASALGHSGQVRPESATAADRKYLAIISRLKQQLEEEQARSAFMQDELNSRAREAQDRSAATAPAREGHTQADEQQAVEGHRGAATARDWRQATAAAAAATSAAAAGGSRPRPSSAAAAVADGGERRHVVELLLPRAAQQRRAGTPTMGSRDAAGRHSLDSSSTSVPWEAYGRAVGLLPQDKAPAPKPAPAAVPSFRALVRQKRGATAAARITVNGFPGPTEVSNV